MKRTFLINLAVLCMCAFHASPAQDVDSVTRSHIRTVKQSVIRQGGESVREQYFRTALDQTTVHEPVPARQPFFQNPHPALLFSVSSLNLDKFDGA